MFLSCAASVCRIDASHLGTWQGFRKLIRFRKLIITRYAGSHRTWYRATMQGNVGGQQLIILKPGVPAGTSADQLTFWYQYQNHIIASTTQAA